MSKVASKKAPKKARCPLCRLPFDKGFEGGENEPVIAITPKRMTEIMNEFGACESKYVDPKTGKYVAPVLEKGNVYATFPGTKNCVQMWCRVRGPHKCETHGLLSTPCRLSLDPDKGCGCDSLSHTQKTVLLDYKLYTEEQKEEQKQAKKQKTAAHEQPEQNELDTIPEMNPAPAPKFVYLAGYAKLVDGTWTFENKRIRTIGTGTAVCVASEEPWTGVVRCHNEIGWCVQREDGDTRHFPLTRDSQPGVYNEVYLIQQ